MALSNGVTVDITLDEGIVQPVATGIPWLVLPTFNEAENLEKIIGRVTEVLEQASPGGFQILVVDDNSPDGTGEIADRLAASNKHVEVLHRVEREGLGPAYIAGFMYVLSNGAEFIFEMDCDFSHDPADLSKLLLTVLSGEADLALGSRYVRGGGTADWGPVRQLISRGGSWYSRQILRLPVRDLTGGFKCFRREVLEAIDLSSVKSNGYSFQVELTYRTLKAGFNVTEVPIIFRDRQHGQSKMSWRIVLEAILLVPRLRKPAPISPPGSRGRFAIAAPLGRRRRSTTVTFRSSPPRSVRDRPKCGAPRKNG